MSIEWLLDIFKLQGDNAAIVYHDRDFSYRWLTEHVAEWEARLDATM